MKFLDRKMCLIAVLMLYAVIAAPAWSAMSDEEFVKLCQKGTAEEIQAALDAGANVNAVDRHRSTPLLSAAMLDPDPKVVEILLKSGADVNAKDGLKYTALYYVAKFSWLAHRFEVMNMLLDAGANAKVIDSQGNTVLMLAGTYDTKRIDSDENYVKDYLGMIRRLLDAGINVNAKNKQGETALLFMHTKAFAMLLDAGADVNVVDRIGATPLMGAVAGGCDIDIVEKILKKCTKDTINAKTAGKTTALMLADNPEAITALIKAGADIDAQDEDGLTALMSATARGNLEAVKALIEAGADANIKDKKGRTAAYFARHSSKEIQAYFEERGIK